MVIGKYKRNIYIRKTENNNIYTNYYIIKREGYDDKTTRCHGLQLTGLEMETKTYVDFFMDIKKARLANRVQIAFSDNVEKIYRSFQFIPLQEVHKIFKK